jgi:hypothetical protein
MQGQRVSLNGSNETFPNLTGCDLNVSVLKPDATPLTTLPCWESGGFLDVTTLPDTGNYTVALNPGGPAFGTITLTLYEVPADLTGSITAGTPLPVTVDIPGRNAAITFTGSAGQRVSLRGTSTFPNFPGCDLVVGVSTPSGPPLAALPCWDLGGFLDATTLPEPGTYTIAVDPAGAATGTLTLTLYNVPPDVTGTLTIGAAAVPVSLNTPGQNAAFTFAGTNGQQVTVRLTANGIGSTTVRLKRPDGTTQTSATSSATNFNLATVTLASPGIYTVQIDPASFNTGTISVRVTSP